MPNKQTQWSRAYNEKAYDRLAITIPKGQKELIESAARSAGESINAFVNRAILMRLRLKDWPEKKKADDLA